MQALGKADACRLSQAPPLQGGWDIWHIAALNKLGIFLTKKKEEMDVEMQLLVSAMSQNP